MTRLRVAMDARFLVAPALRGMDRYTISLAAALARRGVEVTFLGRASAPLHARHVERAGARALLLPDPRGIWWEQVAVPRAIAQHRFDVYHAPAERGVPRWAPCPRVLTWHSATTWSYTDLIRRGELPGEIADYLGYDPMRAVSPFHRWYARGQPAWAEAIVTVSEFSRREIVASAGLAADRVHVTPLAADEAFFTAPRAAESAAMLAALGVRPPFLLYVGGYERHKNVHGLLRCFAACRRARPDLRLVVVGTTAAPPAPKEDAERLGIAEAVLFLTDLSDELPALYDAAEAFVSLSWREGFGLPALEALARGVLPVVSGIGASSEVVGGLGVLVDPRDVEGAAKEIVMVLGQPRAPEDVAARMTQARRFSWDACAERTLAVYDRVLR